MDVFDPTPAAAADAMDSIAADPLLSACHAHKFGGSSVADAERYRHVAALVQDSPQPRAVVVSAMQGVTDALTALAHESVAGRDWHDAWSRLRDRHFAEAHKLDPLAAHGLVAWLDGEFSALSALLSRIADDGAAQSVPALPAHDLAAVQGLGEVWSSRLLQAALGGEAAGWARLDARDVLMVHPGELGVAVDWPKTRERFGAWRARNANRDVVVTGFVARDPEGRCATLGRNGSDYSGAIFAALFEAAELTIWTDVDGVLSADPRLVPDAVCLPSMSYAEACELAYFGAKVLHPQTMAPAMQAGLPILIRNSRNPSAPGTRIAERSEPSTRSPVKGLSLVRDMALLELSGAGLIGVPGTAERMFAALREAGVSVTMISQGSSEHSICCVVPGAHAGRGRDAVEAAFREAIVDGQVEGVAVTGGIAVLAAVGDGMVGVPGVSARLFDGLARARVNIRAIAQGASERNISVAVADEDAVRGLRAAHSAFWLSPATLSVGLIGPGNVGRALLAQFADALPRFADEPKMEHRLDLRLRAVASSRAMALADAHLDPAEAIDALNDARGQALDLDRFVAHVRAEHLPHALIVDCSGSDAVAERYPEWLAMGIHIVTPSKHAGSGGRARYRAIRDAEKRGGLFRYEATVGAGLPVIQTLRSLLDTGDTLTAIEGVLSGTLAWLFNRYDGSQPFSQLVAEAKSLGYTEPDPRDDLSGTDVARKLVILAREAGRPLSLSDVEIESLVPEALRDVPRDEFLARMHELDAPMQARLDAARAQGRSLRYLAQFDAGGLARVGLATPEPGHASLYSRLTDNLIQFRTRRYAHNPLVVQGPGAGADVTAAGVFGDILAIACTLGARPLGAHASQADASGADA